MAKKKKKSDEQEKKSKIQHQIASEKRRKKSVEGARWHRMRNVSVKIRHENKSSE